MKNLIKLEEVAFFILVVVLFTQLGYSWWVFLALLFVPDLSMLGYLFNKKTGAIIYNIVHFRGLAIFIYLTGTIFVFPYITLAGLIMLAHSTFDRIFDYGLKYFRGFKYTHLGELSK